MTRLVRKPYERVRSPFQFPYGNEKVTDDSHGNDTEINKIIARFKRSGELPPGMDGQPQYGDCSELQGDLTAIIAKGEEARAAIEKLQMEQIEANKKASEENKLELERLKKLEAEMLSKQQVIED